MAGPLSVGGASQSWTPHNSTIVGALVETHEPVCCSGILWPSRVAILGRAGRACVQLGAQAVRAHERGASGAPLPPRSGLHPGGRGIEHTPRPSSEVPRPPEHLAHQLGSMEEVLGTADSGPHMMRPITHHAWCTLVGPQRPITKPSIGQTHEARGAWPREITRGLDCLDPRGFARGPWANATT